MASASALVGVCDGGLAASALPPETLRVGARDRFRPATPTRLTTISAIPPATASDLRSQRGGGWMMSSASARLGARSTPRRPRSIHVVEQNARTRPSRTATARDRSGS